MRKRIITSSLLVVATVAAATAIPITLNENTRNIIPTEETNYRKETSGIGSHSAVSPQTTNDENQPKEGFSFKAGEVAVSMDDGEAQVTVTAYELLKGDALAVCGSEFVKKPIQEADIVIASLDNKRSASVIKRFNIDIEAIRDKHEAFLIEVIETKGKARLIVIGSDKRGTAYGLMTLSEELGVSPWAWWADCTPRKRDIVTLASGYRRTESPTVAYRGIFLNDEDWGLCPWSSTNYEPKMRALNGKDATPRKGEIGPYTHERIFELLMRLKANTFWPAMHECSVPFYFTPGNKEMADKYGILVSTSHCEPMMRNTNGEWKSAGKGDYNFVTNAEGVTAFWEERIEELAGSDCIYTLGMRGVHDSGMRGAKTTDEQTAVLAKVIETQRALLTKHVDKQVSNVPQQFIPYKEVLDCYNNGLKVPDEVTLIWCDDNYGYIRHFPTAEERKRSGGHGMYYHISYWGRPHDYLWLSTTHPELIREEMMRAYDNGVERTWILNVGDIKPMEFNISLFLDMAWNVELFRAEESVDKYMSAWYGALFGERGKLLTPLWKSYYDESFSLRPEFTGGTRTEERDPRYKEIADVQMSAEQIMTRLAKLGGIPSAVNTLSGDSVSDAWYQLVEYPLKSMVYMNEKMLGAQLARHGLWEWERVTEAQEAIKQLTQRYNALGGGKWQGMMDYRPRRLPVFNDVKQQTFDTPMPTNDTKTLYRSTNRIGTRVTAESPLTIAIDEHSDTIKIIVELLPVHPTDNKDIAITLTTDTGEKRVITYQTKGRSEEWKQNVLYNKAKREISLPGNNKKRPLNVTISTDDEGVYIQTIKVKE